MKQIALMVALAALGCHFTHASAAESLTGLVVDQGDATPTNTKLLTADMATALRKAGFTDLEIMPNSILVRGKDKAGKPVAMVINPNSMTEVVTLDPHSGSAAGGNGSKTLTGSSTFATVLPSTKLGSNLVGLKVRNEAAEEVGTIKDLAIDHDGISAYIVAVGGPLAIPARYVAVTPKAIEVGYDKAANAYFAKMKATRDQLKAAPPFTYDGAFGAGRK